MLFLTVLFIQCANTDYFVVRDVLQMGADIPRSYSQVGRGTPQRTATERR